MQSMDVRAPSQEARASDLGSLARQALCCAHGAGRGDHAADEALRATLRRLCEVAQGSSVRAEELIIVLKGTWRSSPELRNAARDPEGATLARAITLCIGEYYARERGH